MGCIHRSSLSLQCYLHSQRTNRFRNRDHSSFHRMDEFLHCFHNPSNHILRSNHHCHHCSHRSRNEGCFRMELMNCIHNLRSIRCSHCRIQVLRMGIHIHNRCMGCIHRSSLNLQLWLHSQRTNRLRNRDHSNFHRMDDFLHCFHNPSNRILRSIRCSHCRIQVLRMGIRIHNRCMGCIHRSSLNLQCYLHSQRTNRFRNRDHSSFHRMDEFLHCFHNPSNHILRSNHHCHHCIHSRTSRSCFRMELMNCIHNLRSIRCSHCRIQVHHMGIHIHNRCMGCIHQS